MTIVCKDKGVMWLLLGRTKQFATLPFDGSTGVRLERSMVQEIRRETVGTKILDGHPTTLFQITVQEGKEAGQVRSYSRNLLYNPARLILRFLAASARFP